MRILMVSNLYPPIVYGGYEILCQQACRELTRRGHDVVVVCSSFRRGETVGQPHVHRVLSLTTDFPLPGQSVGKVDFSLATMQRIARHNQAATMHVLGGGHFDLMMAWCLNRLSPGPLLAARSLGVPIAYTINDEHPRQFRFTEKPRSFRQVLRMLSERFWYRQATFRGLVPFPMLIISQALKNSLLEQGASVQGARVLLQGVPLQDFPFTPMPRKSGQPLKILYAGQLSKAKGVHTLLEAGSLLAPGGEVDFHITVAGSGVADYEQSLRTMAAQTGLSGRVEFLGQVEHLQVAALHRRHHVLVFPSIWAEPFGLAHLEAMASGCAVISTTTGGSAELIIDGKNALAFAAGDSAGLARCIERLFKDEQLRRRLVDQARRHVETRHSFGGYIDQMESFLKQVTENQL